MNKRGKKGFSLIELLAVVIILAILALITIPVVGNLIKQARINAAVVSAYGYVEATNNEVVSKQTKGENVDEIQYEISNYNIVDNLLTVKYEGRGPEKGWFILEREKVKKGEFCINGYEVDYDNGKAIYNPRGDFCAPPPRPTVCRINDDLDYDSTTIFEISSIEDLVCLSDLVASGKTFSGKRVILTKDLNFNDEKSYNDPNGILNNHSIAIKQEMTTNGFNPIGNSSTQFLGIFTSDYNVKSSSNMYTIKNLYINKPNQEYAGFIGYLGSTGKLTGVRFEQANIKGKKYTGLVGNLNSGTILGINIYNSTFTGGDYTSAIAGYQKGNIDEVSVIKSYIKGNSTVATASGYIYSGNVTSVYVGDCTIEGNSHIGGLIGNKNSNSNQSKGVVENSTLIGNSSVGAASHSAVSGPIYTSNNDIQSTSIGSAGYTYDNTKHSMPMYDDALDTYIGGDDGDGFYMDFEDDDSNLIIVKKTTESSFPVHLSGTGTQDDPYILSSERDFKEATTLLNGGYYFKINNDIDISTFKHFYGLGTENNFFNGKLLGNDKTITNMHINSGKASGLIGYANGATIKDLNITNSSVINRFTGSEFGSGILVGKNASTNISHINILNSSVSGKKNTGAISGDLNGGSVLGVNIDSSNITGENYTSGVVGCLRGNIDEVAINNSYIKGKSTVAGVTGYIYSGNVTSTYVGGCTIEGDSHIGGFIGNKNSSSNQSKGVVENCTLIGDSSVGAASHSAVSGPIYTSNNDIQSTSIGSAGYTYDNTKHSMPMYDDALDTYIGGDDGDGYYLDYETNNSNKIVVKKTDDHSFDNNLSGTGTLNDPYILSTEQDFKEATTLLNGGYYFKLNNDIDISTFKHFYGLGTENNYFNGKLLGNDKTITNMIINTGKSSGLVGYANGATIKDLNITYSSVNNRFNSSERGTGILIGYSQSSYTENISVNNITTRGYKYIGGLVGYLDGGRILGCNVKNVSVTSSNDKAAALTSYMKNNAEVREVSILYGSITGNDGVNGVTSYITTGGIYNAYVSNLILRGSYRVAGLVGTSDSNAKIYGIVNSCDISGTGGDIGIIAGRSVYGSNLLYGSSDTIVSSNAYGETGISYSPSDNNLDFFGSKLFSSNKPLLEHSGTGDTNNSGYWFINDINGDIIVVKAGETPTPPPVCDPDCPPVEIENFNNITGTCPDGDVTPPVCTFDKFEAVPNGIRAYFSCTDETSVPTIVSMFNATTKASYTAQMILDRGGTQKTGSVSGTTRIINSTWTPQTVPNNPPQEGLCYYYQFTAKDACNNESDWVTKYCAYGFNNGVTITGSE